MEIREFLDDSGGSPFARWFDDLDSQAAAKVTVALARMEAGNLSNVKSVGEGVLEYRIAWGAGYRLYFGQDGDADHPALRRDQASAARRHRGGARRTGPRTRDAGRTGEVALTRSFKDTVKARADRNPAFRDALLAEAVDQFLAGDLETGKAVLRDYINATVGFERLAQETGTSPKSLMCMLGPTGNPTASNMFGVLHTVQKASGVQLAVAVGR